MAKALSPGATARRQRDNGRPSYTLASETVSAIREQPGAVASALAAWKSAFRATRPREEALTRRDICRSPRARLCLTNTSSISAFRDEFQSLCGLRLRWLMFASNAGRACCAAEFQSGLRRLRVIRDWAMSEGCPLYLRSLPISGVAAKRRDVPCVDGSELARAFFTFAALVGAAMCSAFRCGSHDRWP